MNKTISCLRGALMVMEAAEEAGLPIPEYVCINHGDEVYWQPETLEDLYAWSTYLEEPVRSGPRPEEGKIFHYVGPTTLFDQRISLALIERVEAQGAA